MDPRIFLAEANSLARGLGLKLNVADYWDKEYRRRSGEGLQHCESQELACQSLSEVLEESGADAEELLDAACRAGVHIEIQGYCDEGF